MIYDQELENNSNMNDKIKYIVNQAQNSWKVVDDEVIIINFETTLYFSLNGTGSYIWQLLEKEALPLSQIINSVCEYYELDEDVIKDDIIMLIDELCQENLISEDEKNDKATERNKKDKTVSSKQ